MSRETIEVVRHAYEAFNRGDLEDMAAAAAPEFEYVATGVIPGAGGV
jgi:ketosteroid isomerase-like protein